MSTLFPTAYDTFVDPGPNDSISTVAHNLNHGQANDAIAGMQVYIGISSSVGAATLTGQIKALQAQIPSTASQNFVFAGPVSGGAGAPAMRALVPLDIPWLTATAITSSGAITSTTGFVGPLTGAVTGNVTGNVSGSSGSCTGNAATATTAAACSGNSATATSATTATTAGTCTGNAATATLASAATGPLNGSLGATTPNTIAGTSLAISAAAVTATITSSAGNATATISASTGAAASVIFALSGVGQFRIGTNAATTFFADVVYSWNPILYTAGAVGAGFLTYAGTLDASSSTVAANVMSGGLAVAKSAVVGTNVTAGGTITAAGAASLIVVGNNTATAPQFVLNRASGSTGAIQFQTAGVAAWQLGMNAGNAFFIFDNVNNVTQLTGTPGSIATGFITCPLTLSASSSTVGAFVIGNGTAATSVAIGGGNLQVGTNVTAGGSVVLNGGALILNSVDAAYSGNAGVSIYRGNSAAFAANTCVIQSGGGTTAGGNLYFGQNNGTTTSTVLLAGLNNPTANTFSGSLLYGRNNAAADTAGCLGESITSTVSAVAPGASGATANVTSIALTAGKWLISGHVTITGGATGLTGGTTISLSVGVATGANGTVGLNMIQKTVEGNTLGNDVECLSVSGYIINISAGATEYMTANISYASGAPTISGSINAVRIA